MAKMYGCEAGYYDKLKNPGTGNKMRIEPAKYGRSGLSMGGCNQDLNGGAKDTYKPAVKAKGAHQGHYTHMPKGK